MQSGRSKAAIYVRVSTADQHVESQLYDLRELAVQRGLEVVQEYRDSGVSGKKARRPGLDALIADARHKRFSVVLVAAFDRVARSVRVRSTLTRCPLPCNPTRLSLQEPLYGLGLRTLEALRAVLYKWFRQDHLPSLSQKR